MNYPFNRRPNAGDVRRFGFRGVGVPAFVGGGGGNPPVNTVAPVASGSPMLIGSNISCTTGTWTGDPTITYTYQWKRAGVNIVGATSSTYTLVAADLGPNLTCDVTGTNGIGSSTATSNAIAFGDMMMSGVRAYHTSEAGVTETLTAVSSWADQSGNAQNWGTPAAMPQYMSSGFGPNNLPYIRFDGIDDYMLISSLNIGSPLNTWTMAMVVDAVGTTASRTVAALGTGSRPIFRRSSTNTIDMVGIGNIVSTAPAAGLPSGTPRLVIFRCDGTNQAIALHNTVVVSTAQTSSLNDLQNVSLGATRTGTTPMALNIARFIFCNAAWSQNEIDSYAAFCNWKYGVT